MSTGKSPLRSHAEIDRLLPWYANDTLSEAERAEVETHLDTCDACTQELARCRATARTLREDGGVAPQPHPAQLSRLMKRIDSLDPQTATPTPRWQRVSNAAARLLAGTPRTLRWAFAAQLTLVALLGFLLLRPSAEPSTSTSASTSASTSDPASPAQFRTLSESPDSAATAGTGRTLLRVVFTEELPERELRAMLLELRAEIVGGPSPFGVYTLAVPAAGAGAEPLDSLLEHLRTRPGVRFAESVPGAAPR